MPTLTIDPCPECAANKHANCPHSTWDNENDVETVCPCYEADPARHERDPR